MQDPMIGRTVLGRYRIVRALAKGGMGIVYLARSEGASGFQKPVVVKRMASDLMADEGMARMFVREARLMSRLRHPGIVSVIDFGEESGDYLMIIEYVHGFHLGQWQRFMRQAHGPFPADLTLHIAIKVLDALHYGHTLKGDEGAPLSIVHRDVSPSNILIDVEGHVKLADFGVARSRDQTEQTEQSTIKGKMPYLAPELFRLEDPSPSSDAYAAGVVIHEMLVGRNEFRAQDVATTVSRVLEHVPTHLSQVRPDLPAGLADVVAKALGKTATSRYPDAGSLAAALREVRPGTEEELQARLVAEVAGDFLDPRMAEVLGVPSLVEREQSWKGPAPAARPASYERISRSSAPPTVVEKRGTADEDIEISIGDGKRSRWLIAAVAVVLLAVVGTVVGFVVEGRGNGQQTFVVVESTRPNEEESSEPEGAETTQPETTEPEGGGDETGPDGPQPEDGAGDETEDPAPGSPRPRRETTAEMLRRTFSARVMQVHACFNPDALPADRLEISFDVAASGEVTAVNVLPPAVGNTDAGRCVAGVARGTRFPRLDQPVRFSLPVRLRLDARRAGP